MPYGLALSLAFLAAEDLDRLLRPPLLPTDHFPCRVAVGEALALNRRYAEVLSLEYAQELEPSRREWLFRAAGENDSVWWLWDCLRCREEPRWTWELRRLLGEEAFAAGIMPPPVPLWRFRVIE